MIKRISFLFTIILCLYGQSEINTKGPIIKKEYQHNGIEYILSYVEKNDGYSFLVTVEKKENNEILKLLNENELHCPKYKKEDIVDVRLLFNNNNAYLNYGDEFSFPRLLKFSNNEIELIREPIWLLDDNTYHYAEIDGRIYFIITQEPVLHGDHEYEGAGFDFVGHLRYIFDDEKLLWFPIDKKNNLILNEPESAITNFKYSVLLKRWYPFQCENINLDVWFSNTPNKMLRDIAYSLSWEISSSINLAFIFKKFIEQEHLKLEEEKRIAEEKQKLQQKIFIILGILFLVIFGGFLIKRLKKKKIIKDHKR